MSDISKSPTDMDAIFAPLSDPHASNMGMGSSGSQQQMIMSESMSMMDTTATLMTTTPVSISINNETVSHHAGDAVTFKDLTNDTEDDEDFGDFEEATFSSAPISTSTTADMIIPETTFPREDENMHAIDAMVFSDAASDMISSSSSVPVVPIPTSVPKSIEEFTKLNFDSFMVTNNVNAASTSDNDARSSAIFEQPSSPVRHQSTSLFTTDTIGVHDSSLSTSEVQSMPSPMGFNALDQLVFEDMDEPIPLTTNLLTTIIPVDKSLLSGSFASFGSSSSTSVSMGMNNMTGGAMTKSSTTLPTRASILDLFDTNTASSSSQRNNYSALEVSSNLDDSALHTLAIQLADKKYFEESHCCFQKLAYRRTILALHNETKQDKVLDIQRRLELQKVSIISCSICVILPWTLLRCCSVANDFRTMFYYSFILVVFSKCRRLLVVLTMKNDGCLCCIAANKGKILKI